MQVAGVPHHASLEELRGKKEIWYHNKPNNVNDKPFKKGYINVLPQSPQWNFAVAGASQIRACHNLRIKHSFFNTRVRPSINEYCSSL